MNGQGSEIRAAGYTLPLNPYPLPITVAGRLCCIALGLLLHAVPASAHPLAPSLLDIREIGDGQIDVLWKTPRLQVTGANLRPVVPERCRELKAPDVGGDAVSVTLHWRLDCGGSLSGESVGVQGLASSRTQALVRIALADGRVLQRVLRAGEPSLVIPARAERFAVLRDYARLGVEHILTGFDHLLFIFGLLLLVPDAWSLAKTITAFTLGHSITLSLAVLDVVRLPSRPIEVAISLSILALAVELARGPQVPSAMRRRPWAMALLFGMLHGLGFAGALREVGLPQGEIPLALFAFNVGIEAGQLAFVVWFLLLRPLVRRLLPWLPQWVEQVPVYVIGSLAAYWCFERAAALF